MLFLSFSREDFINMLKLRFAHINQVDTLAIYGVDDDTIRYCMTANDRKYGYTKLPEESAWLRHEEIAGSWQLEEESKDWDIIVEEGSDDEDNFTVSTDITVDNNRTPVEVIEQLQRDIDIDLDEVGIH